jgi:HD superfamily phosphohydrolase
MLEHVGEIRDPVHGYVFMTQLEKDLIDTRPFQRLRRIKQLSGAYFTYPGAEHTRFSHSIGVMHLAGVLGGRLAELGYLDEEDVQKVRIAGLLHDVGHGPFAHIYEEVLHKYREMTHEDIAQWLIRESELREVLLRHGFAPDEIAQLAVGRLETGEKGFLNQVIASQFDVDIMDYLVRDSYFCGVEYGKVDVVRLIYALEVFDDALAVDVDALEALEALVIARYEMFNAVYFHRTVRAAEVMISRAMDFANEPLGITSFTAPEEFLRLDDCSVLIDLVGLEDEAEPLWKVARDLATSYCNRRLFKRVHTRRVYHRNDFYTNIMSREEIRHQLEAEIGRKAGVDPEYVIIDVPTVPSVPYYPRQGQPSDMPVYEKRADGSRELRRLSEYSQLVNALIGYMDIVRVYTAPRFRDAVKKAADHTFGRQPYSAKISM